MDTLVEKNKTFNLAIPVDMVDNKLVKKLMSLIRFRELTKDINVTEDEIFQLSEESKERWWKENKEWFLNGIKQ